MAIDEDDPAVENYKTQARPSEDTASLKDYGTIGCGYEAMTEAWTTLHHKFSIGAAYDSQASYAYPGNRAPASLLQDNPVDLLVIERSHIRKRLLITESATQMWEDLVIRAERRPKVIFETWQPTAGLWESGPGAKGTRLRWEALGYDTRTRLVESTRCGGAVKQSRLIVVRLDRLTAHSWNWPELDSEASPRPSSNLLTPPGLVPRRAIRDALPKGVNHAIDPLTGPLLCNSLDKNLPWIQCPNGYRRVFSDEVGRALGLPKTRPPTEGPHKGLGATTSVFHWEYLSQALQTRTPVIPKTFHTLGTTAAAALRRLLAKRSDASALPPSPEPVPIDWTPPDLSPGGRWWKKRVRSLMAAAAVYGSQAIDITNQGLEDLRVHRRNYDSTGPNPVSLKILWWEFPQEHWEDLRLGSSMNFLVPPPTQIHPNGEMDDEQRQVAEEFVDELIDLNVLREPPPGVVVLTTTPLFVLPKPGQPGQWRVIANMLEGGQNACSGNDPVYLNRPLHILEQMYTGGWTAVVDASKFFYQFDTHKDDYPHLGMIHPTTGKMYVWGSLPMGARNSPSCAGRYGLALLRRIHDTFESNRGKIDANCWWTGLSQTGYDPKLGYGYVLHRKDGQPAVRFWVHVDDFAIHGPTLAATEEALRFFLDAAVDVGMLCHPRKLYPPSQTPLYTGFIFDTRSTPTLRVPTPKREKALAMVEYVLNQPVGSEISRLVLSVVSGVLESLSEATPARLGHTYLRRVYNLVHEPDQPLGRERYYTKAAITQHVKDDLQWWKLILEHDLCRPARGHRAGTLIPTFGDGSGTGTGGTIEVPGTEMSMWMGQWAPLTRNRTSNWKELKTLMLTLQEIAVAHPDEVAGSTLFYFTDNTPTYYVSAAGSSPSPGLHEQVEQIRHLELALDCRLQVVHIPGKAIIEQGTDGLSRGVWISEWHRGKDPRELTESIFRPTPVQPHLITQTCQQLGWNPHACRISDWRDPLQGHQMMHRYSCHFPPPELARQAIIFFLEAWVESPLDTGAIFFVPRVLSAFWHGLSRHVQELPAVPSRELLPEPLLPIPLVVLVVKPHTRALRTSTDLDDYRGALKGWSWHQKQANYLRSLQPSSLQPRY